MKICNKCSGNNSVNITSNTGNCNLCGKQEICFDFDCFVDEIIKQINQDFINADELSTEDDRETIKREALLNEYFDGENMHKKLFDAILEKLEHEFYAKNPYKE